MTTRSYPEKFYVLDRLDQYFEMMSQICQIHVEFHVSFVRFEAHRNVVQDMTCMVSFETFFFRNVFVVVPGSRNNISEHKSIVFSEDISHLEAVKARTNPPQIHGFDIFFRPRIVVFAVYDENMTQKCIPRVLK